MQRILFLSIQTRVDRGRLRRSAQRTHEDIARTGADGGRELYSAIEAVEPSASARAALPFIHVIFAGF